MGMSEEPTRATLKGHGNPDRIMYFGTGAKPWAVGMLVEIQRVRGGANTISLAVATRPGWLGSATKFWGAPVNL